MKQLIYWTWCLPQTLLGFIVKALCKAKPTQFKNFKFYTWSSCGGISLGKYIIIYPYKKAEQLERVLKHESGHQVQSFILGPLYLLVIGLPSIIWNVCFRKYRAKYQIDYYSFYTEKWANKLGGLK